MSGARADNACMLLGTQHASLQEGYDVLGGYISPVNGAYHKEGLASSADRIAMSQVCLLRELTIYIQRL